MTTPALRLFRIAAVAEAFSWAGLLVGMVFKYLVVHNDIGVWFFGRLHGGLFVLYLAAALWAARDQRWSARVTLLGLAASVPPLTTVWFERWVRNRKSEPASVERELVGG